MVLAWFFERHNGYEGSAKTGEPLLKTKAASDRELCAGEFPKLRDTPRRINAGYS